MTRMQATVLKKPTYSIFVYNSSGSQSGNRYNTWSDLMTAAQLQSGRKIIALEQNETVPAGAWNFDNIEWWGTGEDGTGGAAGSATLTFPTGVTISSWAGLKIVNYGLYFKSTSSAAILSLTSNATLTVQNVAGIGTTTAPFFTTTANFVLAGQGNARLKNIGYEIVEFTGSAYSQQAIINLGPGTACDSNVFRSTNPVIMVNVLSTDVIDASLYPVTNTNIAGGSVNVGVNFIYAANIQYNVRTSTTGTISCSKSYAHERANASGGNVTYTLRSAVGGGDRVSFKKVDSSGNSMIINRAGSDTIDGATSLTTSTQYAGWILQDVSSGVWDIVGVF